MDPFRMRLSLFLGGITYQGTVDEMVDDMFGL